MPSPGDFHLIATPMLTGLRVIGLPWAPAAGGAFVAAMPTHADVIRLLQDEDTHGTA